jgi:hypothetical protein
MAGAKTKQYRVAKGFNIGVTDEDLNGTRYEPGTDEKPVLVDPKEFDTKVWKDLVEDGAIEEFTDNK